MNEQNKESQEYLDYLRHSAAHLLAAAVLELYPDAKPTIGPSIENGFYYDFEFSEPISDKDLKAIQKKMKKLSNSWKSFERKEVSANEAREIYKDNPYKLELINDLEKEGATISLYTSGDFTDLCRGGHVDEPNKELKHFKLLSLAGAYWRGDEKNSMLTRIYGTAFATKEELDEHLAMLEEAKKRDHRVIGQKMELFTFSDQVGPGLVLWKPNGTIIRNELEKWAFETEEAWGYKRVATPHIAKHTLFETSGHLPYYKDDMYSPMKIDDEDYYLKGMNCPLHHMIYASEQMSYRDLPLRLAEYGTCYRYEQSGSLFGLMRVRAISMNDAHIYCSIEDAEEEFYQVLKLHEYYYEKLGLTKDDYYAVVGLPDPKKSDKYHGEKDMWDTAERIMRKACDRWGIEVKDDIGGAAFYGPKIDINIRSATGREFTISTNQLDLFMPERFDLEYTAQDGTQKRPAVIHRAPLGSHERFIGFLIEHFAGNFPLWLAPVQVAVLPVSEKHNDIAASAVAQLKSAGIRVELDDDNKTLPSKIRRHTLQKVPYMCIIGDKEAQKSDSSHDQPRADLFVSVRSRAGEDEGMRDITSFIDQLQQHIAEKKIT